MLETKDTAPVEVEPRTKSSSRNRTRNAPSKRTGNRNTRAKSGSKAKGLNIPRMFSKPNVHPFDELVWEKRTAAITGDKGEVIFEQDDVEVPASWSMLATNIVASKYFYGAAGTDEREHSLKQLIHRVTRTIADWGLADGLFASKDDAETFYHELTWLCVNQHGSFNSPVWFNCGLYHEYKAGRKSCAGNYYFDPKAGKVKQAQTQYEYPQCSACFIQAVDDSMDDIMKLARSEAMLFKFGSGTGTDLSTLRSSRESLRGGGKPSGPLSFLRVYDAIAGVVKSGGKTRRAAKMNTLKIWHPDIKDFIESKQLEEKKAWALIEQGYSGDFNGDAYGSIRFQNENLSVRVTDEFMQAVLDDKEWQTWWVTQPDRPGPKYKARDLLRWIAEGTWVCGDPGMQYEDTIQRWHTCKKSGPINSSNPCSEYMFVDNSACNLASLNLIKFMDGEGRFDTVRFKAAVDIFITAQEILVDHASYPTEKITENSHRFRPLGLGYANLGAYLMASGHPYDSDDGRALAAAITAIMHLEAYSQSSRLSELTGPFDEYEKNEETMLDVIRQHRDAVQEIHDSCPEYLLDEAARCGMDAVKLGEKHGFRNAQVTVLAPTGTIGFMMDCDTTGIEPDIALVKYKTLAGGGMLKIVNRTVASALEKLGYNEETTRSIEQYIDEQDTIEGAPNLKDDHLPVFDCAFKPRNGKRSIPYQGHIRMMAAVQPFLSGAISKTVNVPTEATVEEVMDTYIESWRLGLKAVAIYRDGCKRSQPLNTGSSGSKSAAAKAETETGTLPLRRRMPSTRSSITHKFDIAGHEGYITVGLYEDGAPGEMFITMAKEGSTIGGLMDAFGTAISLCLQYRVPIKTLVDKFVHSRFEPSGFTKNPDIPIAKSLVDYIFRWMGQAFLEKKAVVTTVSPKEEEKPVTQPPPPPEEKPRVGTKSATGDLKPRSVDEQFQHFMQDAPVCDVCGSITVRNGACYKCFNCGNSMGCS